MKAEPWKFILAEVPRDASKKLYGSLNLPTRARLFQSHYPLNRKGGKVFPRPAGLQSQDQQLRCRRFIPSFTEKSCLILLPTYGCLESSSGQSGMPMRR